MLVFLEKLFFPFIPVHLLLSPFQKARLLARAYKLPVTTKCTGTIVKNANALKWNNDHTIFYYVRGLLISLLLPVFDERYNKDILLCVLSCFMSNRRIMCRQVMPDLG